MQFYDGGAFADCPYIQYPNGMGRQRAPATVLNAAAAAAASSSSASAAANRSHGAMTTPSLTTVRPAPVSTTATAASSSSSTATRGASARFNDSHALALVPTPSPSASTSVVLATSAAAQPHKAVVETAEETTARTARHLQDTLQAARQTTEVFDGRSLALRSRQRAAANTPNAASNALTIVVSGSDGVPGARESDPGPIVRSPTKDKKNKFTDALLLRSTAGGKTKADGADGPGEAGQSVAAASSTAMVMAVTAEAQQGSSSSGGGGGAAASRKVVVPFSVSNWQNRKKIIVPVEQRLAQQHDDRLDSASDMGDAIMDLAVAMQKASKEVAAEMAAKERAKAEEEERQQAALEAAEAARAKQLLEQKAAELAANAQRRETREQRLERIKLERELREQEKLAKQEQRMRERAAARLNISVEDLEADEQLLHAVEEASVHAGTLPSAAAAGPVKQEHGSLSGLAAAPLPASASSPSPISRQSLGGGEGEEDEDGDGTVGGRRKPAVRGGVFASAVISNEGIQREMEALAALGAAGTAHDGIRMREEGPSDSEDGEEGEDADGGAFQLHKFVKKKKRL